jgi:hypothetical protein
MGEAWRGCGEGRNKEKNCLVTKKQLAKDRLRVRVYDNQLSP